MSDLITLVVNGRPLPVQPGATVAAALLGAGVSALRRSVTGQPRGPVCGMGVCFECRVTVDGIPHRLGCQTLCAAGMEVQTDGP
jgi:D-hydroxyproline dehydrogenase subunit gamma